MRFSHNCFHINFSSGNGTPLQLVCIQESAVKYYMYLKCPLLFSPVAFPVAFGLNNNLLSVMTPRLMYKKKSYAEFLLQRRLSPLPICRSQFNKVHQQIRCLSGCKMSCRGGISFISIILCAYQASFTYFVCKFLYIFLSPKVSCSLQCHFFPNGKGLHHQCPIEVCQVA